MYTILIKSNDMLIKTHEETIMHRTSFVRKLQFLVDPTYVNGSETLNMRDYICLLEIRLPISNKYIPIVLTPSEELYKEKLEYILDVDTKLTSEVGDVEIKLMWMTNEMLASGDFKNCIRKTLVNTITVLPVDQWSDYIPSSDLDNIAQIMLSNQAQMKQLKDFADYLHMTKADTLSYNKETNELSIGTASQKLDSVILEDCNCEDGIPVVEFNDINPEQPSQEIVDNVVEF